MDVHRSPTFYFTATMRALGAAYLVAGLATLFFPVSVIGGLNLGPSVLSVFGWTLEPLTPAENPLWSALAAIHLLTLSALSLLTAHFPRRYAFPAIHLAAKAISFLAFWRLYFHTQRAFAYAFMMAFDGAAALLLLGALARTAYATRSTPDGIPPEEKARTP